MENIEWSRTDLIDETDEMVSHRQAMEKEKNDDPGITFHEEQHNRVQMTTVVVNAKGEAVKADATVNNGVMEVPYIKLDPVSVGKDELMDTVIADEFHSYDDVYKNVPESDRP